MRTLLASAALALVATSALAVEITYPATPCATIVGTDLSTPSGDSTYYVFEILCKDAQGGHKIFVTTWATAGAFLGFGRSTAPTQITLTPGDVSELVVDE